MIDLRAEPGLRTALLALNREVEEKTSVLDHAGLGRLLDAASLALCETDAAGQPLGFVIAFRPGADYASPNYRWFCARLEAFLYIDRVVVAEAARGRGLARRLYAAAEAAAAGVPLVCEVNSDPPNPGSDAFHDRLGFTEMGRGSPAPGKTVRYLIRAS